MTGPGISTGRIDKCDYVKLESNTRRGRVMIGESCIFYGSAAEARRWHAVIATAYITGFSNGIDTTAIIKAFAPKAPQTSTELAEGEK